MSDPVTSGGTVAHLFHEHRNAEMAVTRLRASGFADVRISERGGTTTEAHVPAASGLTEADFAQSLRRAGFGEHDAERLARGVGRKETLVTVVAGTRVDDALAVLRGESVVAAPLAPVDAAEAPPASGASAVAPAVTSSAAPVAPAGEEPLAPGDRVVALRGEQVDVATERTSSDARIRRETVTEQRTVVVPVSHEELVVERDGIPPVRVNLDDKISPEA